MNRPQIFAAPFFALTFFFGMGILENKKMTGEILAQLF
jgi:hypothetical protein